jgi:hypothetical protein
VFFASEFGALLEWSSAWFLVALHPASFSLLFPDSVVLPDLVSFVDLAAHVSAIFDLYASR